MTTPATWKPCKHPRSARLVIPETDGTTRSECICGKIFDVSNVRRGVNNRKRGNAHELAVARRYGGEKVGPLGLIEDIRGKEFRTQVKSYQRLAPVTWRTMFDKLSQKRDNRTPRLILRFLPGQGIAADDYVIVKGVDWLDRYGRDE